MINNWLAVGLLVVSGILAFNWKRKHPYGQTVEIGEKPENGGRIRRNSACADHLISFLEDDEIYTLYDSLVKSCKKYGERKCFGERKKDSNGNLGKFEWISYNTYLERCEYIQQGLCELGLKPKSKVGIFSKNRLEWLIVHSASFIQSYCVVSFYETLGVESLSYVTEHAEIGLAFCSAETLQKTLDIAKGVKVLKTIICFDSIDKEHYNIAKELGVTLYTYDEIMKKGKEANGKHKHTPPTPDTLSTIMYTSGTTGPPKGVMITHKNLTSVVCAVSDFIKVYDTDVHYSYLPYAHVLERVVILAAFHFGAAIGIFSGDISNILVEVKLLSPTLFIGVPRVFERIKTNVFKEISKKPALLRTLFNGAYNLKYLSIQHGFKLPIIEKVLDLVFFSKIKQALGGKVRVILSGSAPLSFDTEVFLRVVMCCCVLQGYGASEGCGGDACKRLDDESVGTIGPPFASNEIKLVDVPELGYDSNGEVQTGEVCLRGPSISSGYYKDEEKTREEFKDGWFHTGDIGRWNRDGSLSIVDRKKNIFKLSQGEYVAVEKIETIVVKSEYVEQVCIYGDSQKSCVIAIIHPHPESCSEWAGSKKTDKDIKEICKNQDFIKVVLDDIIKNCKKSGLHGFEIPKAIHLTPEAFSDQNNLLTPSFKLKRHEIKKYFEDEIKKLYSKLD
ncbi:fatty acyl-CoA synthetase [Dictyostelium discoideum AX4]|uniref:Fatty acyl-CoA synthetase B n=1 Tax=Dictyostelium discoideum TaxID=44689 RepID=FCSB_DICDI|nr:fatty acyl-CoA synthetase [Dictyostelium discoideum AX4]Q1ZXQ4.1 RecName: Full=Fatty acyl-CoA synthetase B; AltName: Full=Long chain fatty acyl coenzyme A-synthetase 2; Short=LC-FACS 2; AltName: Full=Long-chain-fatty-acid--CoA synthetase 2; Flags: Precursor [Dictyostelium discoideum]EAS66934.1 fatty acyl-CoA synthetase [Dictyostelium discoideum AX4]|eukprot:XP_001134470.1 fatty acyl-CoA synthetase [Dictyostelium discoideum AX4]